MPKFALLIEMKPVLMTDRDYVIGIDMGGTNTEFAVVNARGDILGHNSIPTVGHRDIYGYISKLHDGIMEVVERTGTQGRIRGIGAGVPCANRETGCIEVATNLPWPSPIPLVTLLTEAFGIPATISNDANAAAAGEMAYGRARGLKNFIMITLGTGVGSGIVCDGHLLSGSRGFAGELGHVIVDPESDRLCGCGRRGCLETYCSAGGVVKTALDMLAARNEESLLREIGPSRLTAKDVHKAALRGDRIACDVFDFTGKVLGEACADFAAFTDPEAIILFGGVAKAGNMIANPMREAMEDKVLHLYKGRIQVFPSSLNDAEAALLGASALAWNNPD